MAFDVQEWYRDPQAKADESADHVIRPKVRRWMLCGPQHVHCAEDVTQRIKIRFLEAAANGSITVHNEKEALTCLGLMTWYFFHTVVNGKATFKFHEVKTYCLSFRRHAPLVTAEMVAYGGPSPDASVESEQSCARIIALLQSLGDEAEPLIYHVFCHMSYAEIAEQLDCPIGTVRSRIFRIREKLHALLRSPDVQ